MQNKKRSAAIVLAFLLAMVGFAGPVAANDELGELIEVPEVVETTVPEVAEPQETVEPPPAEPVEPEVVQEDPQPEIAAETAKEPVEEPKAEQATVQDDEEPVEGVCDPLDSGKKNLNGPEQVTKTITAPNGKVIVEVCVKAGSIRQGDGPEYTTINPGKASVVISHPSGKGISHYSARYADAPVPVCSEPTAGGYWAVNWGRTFDERTEAPIFTQASHDGLDTIVWDGTKVSPAGSSSKLYLSPASIEGDSFEIVYTFNDGTIWTASVSQDEGLCPVLTWKMTPPPEPSLTITDAQKCGQATITVTTENMPTRPFVWQYGITALVDGEEYGSILVEGDDTKTLTINLDEDQGDGNVEVTYYVHAASEWDLVPDDLDGQSTWSEEEQRGDAERSFEVDSDCKDPVTPDPTDPKDPNPKDPVDEPKEPVDEPKDPVTPVDDPKDDEKKVVAVVDTDDDTPELAMTGPAGVMGLAALAGLMVIGGAGLSAYRRRSLV